MPPFFPHHDAWSLFIIIKKFPNGFLLGGANDAYNPLSSICFARARHVWFPIFLTAHLSKRNYLVYIIGPFLPKFLSVPAIYYCCCAQRRGGGETPAKKKRRAAHRLTSKPCP